MTTHVPEGTGAEAVDDMRTREAHRAQELAAAKSLLRLWRPPLQPGEWRTLGLFAADNPAALEDVLSSMPLRVWRTDTVVELAAHPNDPDPVSMPPAWATSAVEFMTTLDVRVPDGLPAAAVQQVEDDEALRARQLAGEGRLVRLWRLPPSAAGSRTLGLWRARDGDDMRAVLESLPMIAWMDVDTTPLSQHPSDPGRQRLTEDILTE